MDIDGQISVDLGPTTYLNMGQHGKYWDIRVGNNVAQTTTEMPIKRPYLINFSNVEFIEGDWNEDKTEYGIRIGFVSGKTKCFWGSTARKVIEECCPYIKDKFDDRVKAGPPAV